MSVHRLKRNFTSGELSDLLSTRVELERFKNGCELLQNMYVTTQGPAIRRPGTKFIYDMTPLFGEIDEVFSAKDNIREISFVFSETQSYDLTFYRTTTGECYVIFGYLDGIIEDPNDLGQPYKVSLGTDFDILAFDYAQSGDILFIASGSHTQAKLSRYGHTDWRYEDISFTDPPVDWGAGGTPVAWPVTLVTGDAYDFIIDRGTPLVYTNVGDTILFSGITSADPIDQAKLDAGLVVSAINGTAVHFNGVDGNLITVNESNNTVINADYVNNVLAVGGNNNLDLTLDVNPYVAADVVQLTGVYSTNADDNSRLQIPQAVTLATGEDITIQDIAGRNAYLGNSPRVSLEGNSISILQAHVSGTPYKMYATATGQGLVADDYAYFFGLTSDSPEDNAALQGQLLVASVAGDVITIDEIDGNRVSVTAGAEVVDAETLKGFPTKVSFFEQRLVYGSSSTKPQTIWGSRSGDFYDYGISSPLVESDAVSFTLASGEQNKMQWLLSARRLLIGTLGDEWSLGGYGAPLSYKSVVATRQTNQGSEFHKPIMIGSATLFIERLGRAVNEFIYDYNSDSYGTIDVTLLAPHLLKEYGIRDWSYQKSPNGIVWAIRDDGALLGFTYQRKHKVMGWHRHDTDGRFITTATVPSQGKREDEVWFTVVRYIKGEFRVYKEKLISEFKGTNLFNAWFVDSGSSYEESASILLARIVESNLALIVPVDLSFSIGEYVQVQGVYTTIPEVKTLLTRPLRVLSYEPFTTLGYMVLTLDLEDVIRADPQDELLPVLENVTYLEEDVTYLEAKVTHGFQVNAPNEPQKVAEDARVYKSFTVITGLEHLEDKIVHILLNGAVSPPQIVHDGTINLPIVGYKVTIGLPYTSTIIPLEADLELATGSTLGRNQRVTQISVKLHQSVGMKIGRKFSELEEVPFRTPQDLTGQAVPLFSGWVHKSFPEGYDDTTIVIIQQTQPLPLTVIGTVDEVEVYDRYRG